jgi:general L-amino acid transport system substrate-binding protein
MHFMVLICTHQDRKKRTDPMMRRFTCQECPPTLATPQLDAQPAASWLKPLIIGVTVLATLAAAPSTQAAAAPAEGAAQSTLERVRAAGVVTCGIDATPGFSGIDSVGNPTGFDVDFCRAIAAATLGNADAIQTRRISTANKFDALVRGDIDVAFGMTTWTLSRDSTMGTAFPAVIFYDGQGFMAWSDSGVTTLEDLAGQKICVQQGTTSAANLQEMITRTDLSATLIETPNSEEKLNAFAQRRCTVVTGDRSELAANAAVLEPGRGQWTILQQTISSEPLGPVVAAQDWQWFSIVRWVVNTTLVAEAEGLNQSTIAAAPLTAVGERARLLGQDPTFGRGLGLDPQWAKRVITEVGSYDEIFMRNLTPLGLKRGVNALRHEGGILTPLPMR